MTGWEPVVPDVWRYRDSCNVYAILGDGACIVVDAGSGAWLEQRDELPAPAEVVLLTHFFRDHSAGAVAAARAGIRVLVPEGEVEALADPSLHVNRSQAYLYFTYWNHFVPVEPLAFSGTLADHDRLELAGVRIEVLPLPGATVTQVGFAVRVRDREVVFCGETVHSPGRVPRLAPLQYRYDDLMGASNVVRSIETLRGRAPAAVLPSLGEPILEDVDEALLATTRNLESSFLDDERSGGPPPESRFVRASESVWVSTNAVAQVTFVRAASGKVLAIDYGYNSLAFALIVPGCRRGSIDLAADFLRETGLPSIDLAIPSHYHDDHVASIPLLQRVYGTRCWASDAFAELLEHPAWSSWPATSPDPIAVERRLAERERVVWEGVGITTSAISGHTRFAAAIRLEVDGLVIAHVGDQLLLPRSWRDGPHVDWKAEPIVRNHVYRNGATLTSYADFLRLLLDWRPDLILTGHSAGPLAVTQAFFDRLSERAEWYEESHRRCMPLEREDVHFGVDSWRGWITPYRSSVGLGETVVLSVTVRNPLPVAARLTLETVVPTGWTSASSILDAGAHEDATCVLEVVPSSEARRQLVAVEMRANEQPFGQVAEALVTVGRTSF